MGNALYQGLLRAVIQAPCRRGHDLLKHMVDRLNDLRAGAEIPVQLDLPPQPRLGLVNRLISIVFIQENPRLCLTELINGLLDVPYQEAIVGL